jgi:3'-phosphoadenosine 5'-phosphosulfate sulfotransferase (PAPS reductase)/FAD synthetase
VKTVAEVLSQNWDSVVVNISGGKDSSALMVWALNAFPKEKLHFIHAEIDIDWKETLPVVRAQCAHFGVKAIVVCGTFADGSKKGFLSKLVAPRKDRKTGQLKQNRFPDMNNRWCTSELKQSPIHKWIRQNLKGRILNLMGERGEESRQRSNLNEVRRDEKLSCAGREVWNVSPIHKMTEAEVWEVIRENNIPVHPCYSWGVKRASCAICIFSSNADIKVAAKHAPEIVAKYLEAEKKITHTFRLRAATKKREEEKQTIASILKEGAG